jgi:hypothetical protein
VARRHLRPLPPQPQVTSLLFARPCPFRVVGRTRGSVQTLAEQIKLREAARAAELAAARAPVPLPTRPEDFTAFPLEVCGLSESRRPPPPRSRCVVPGS